MSLLKLAQIHIKESHKGLLHKELHVPEGEKIPVEKLKSLKKKLMKKGEGENKLSKKDSKLLKVPIMGTIIKNFKCNVIDKK